MRIVVLTALLGWFAASPATAWADDAAHAEMAAALMAQADLHPSALSLPAVSAAPMHAAAASAVKRGIPAASRPGNAARNAASAADRASRNAQGQGPSQALAHQAQAAAAAAAGQAQSQRAMRHHRR